MAAFEEQFPDCLEFVSRSMRAGHAFSVAIEMAHREFSDPLAANCAAPSKSRTWDSRSRSCCASSPQRVPSMDVQFFVSAVLLQKRTGGNLAELLDKLAQLMRERFKLRARIRAVSAQGLMSGRILSAIPAGVALMMFVVNPQYARFFIDDPVGHELLAAGLATATAGLPDHPQDRDLRGVSMLEVMTAALFVLVAGGTAWAALRAGAWRVRGVRSAGADAGAGEARAAHLARSCCGERAGEPDRHSGAGAGARPAAAQAPPDPRGLPQPNAARYFQGLRLVATLGCGAAALPRASQCHAAPDNVFWTCGSRHRVGYLAPMQYVQLRVRRRQQAIERGLPNTLDLMVVCVESGLGIDQTTLQVAKELQSAHPEICGEFTVMNLELRAGKRRAEALHNLADRTGVDDVKKLVAVLVQTDRFGTSIAQSLRGHAEYLRTMARQRAEERASKLAVKLVFPIFFCVLPSLFVVTIGPVITRLVRELIPMIENM